MPIRSTVARWIPPIAWMGLVFALSSRPGSDIPGGIAPFAHFIEYFILGALVLLALPARSRWLLAASISSAYAVTDELHQAFVPGRTPDPADWAIDTLGALAGAAILAWWLARERAGGARPTRPSHPV